MARPAVLSKEDHRATIGEKIKLSKVGQRVGELRVNQWKRRKEAEEQTVKELRSTGKRLRVE